MNNSAPQNSSHRTRTRRGFIKTAACSTIAAVSGCLSATGVTEGGPPNMIGWRKAFEDTFDQDTLDSAKWGIGYGWGQTSSHSEELALRKNVSIKNGLLRLQQSNPNNGSPYHVGVVNTKNKFYTKNGYFEAKIRMPRGEGLLPACWAKPNSEVWPPEIDFVELFFHNGSDTESATSHHTVHWSKSPGVERNLQDESFSYTLPENAPLFTESFHIFGCEWGTSHIAWYINGTKVAQTKAGINEVNSAGPFYMMLSTHIGRDWLGHPSPSQKWPTYMDVDWVRVWKRGGWG